MKKLFFAVSALAALSLLAPSTGFAQVTYTPSHLGLYTEAMEVNAALPQFQQMVVNLVITTPYNGEESRDVAWVGGYECGIVLNGSGLLTTVTWPTATALNVGTADNQIVAFGPNPIQVVDGAAVLANFNFLNTGDGPLTITLIPAEPTSVPGMMAFLDDEGTVNGGLLPLMTSAGDFANPVFGFNADPQIVATDASSFDNIKAMYR